MNKFTLNITKELVEVSLKEELGSYIYDSLIEQEKIDDNYYDVITESLKLIKNIDCEYKAILYYSLRVNKVWGSLEECSERLEIGL